MTQEVYALAADRRTTTATKFLNYFMPNRLAVADEYPIPECSENLTRVFSTAEELMHYLAVNSTEPYGIYWNAALDEGLIRQAMLFYTSDGYLIFGLAAKFSGSKTLLDQLIVYSGSGIGMMGTEQRPPETAVEFKEMTQKTIE
jgi:hypothetical protein